MKKIDLTGATFGYLTVVSPAETVVQGTRYRTMWNCVCKCGNKVVVSTDNLRSGTSRSCGCLAKEHIRQRQRIDMTGQRYGRLVVLGMEEPVNKRTMCKCQCDCGRIVVCRADHIRNEYTTSCGCYRDSIAGQATKTHGDADSRLYQVWRAVKSRCYNQNDHAYKYYGGRGIKMCDEWKNSYALFKIWAEANGYDWNAERGQCTIDRIDFNGNYCPDNCRWVDMVVQNNNKRNNTHTSKES